MSQTRGWGPPTLPVLLQSSYLSRHKFPDGCGAPAHARLRHACLRLLLASPALAPGTLVHLLSWSVPWTCCPASVLKGRHPCSLTALGLPRPLVAQCVVFTHATSASCVPSPPAADWALAVLALMGYKGRQQVKNYKSNSWIMLGESRQGKNPWDLRVNGVQGWRGVRSSQSQGSFP